MIKLSEIIKTDCYIDCGYMHIPSLITAGLAIKKNNIKQPI